MFGDESGAQHEGVFPGVVGAKAEVVGGVRQGVEFGGLEVDAGAEGCGAVGGCADAALDLDVVNGRSEVGHVNPKDALGFGVVEGDAVDGYVDAGQVAAADAEAGVAYAVACVGAGD